MANCSAFCSMIRLLTFGDVGLANGLREDVLGGGGGGTFF